MNQSTEERCCGRCDGVNDICVADTECEAHDVTGCEICFGPRRSKAAEVTKPRIIIVAGMYRSGSTWLFNCVRNTLLEIGMDFAQTGSCDAPGWNQIDKPILLVKAHEFVQEAADQADLILTSRRNLLGALASWNAFKPNEPKTIEHAVDWIEHLERWRDQRVHRYCMQFDKLSGGLNIIENVRMIANCVGLSIHPTRGWTPDARNIIERNAATTPPAEQDYDPTTYYFKNHITRI